MLWCSDRQWKSSTTPIISISSTGKAVKLPRVYIRQMRAYRGLQAEFPDSGLIDDDGTQMVAGSLQVEKPALKKPQTVDLCKIGINTVMSEADVLLTDLERFIVPRVSRITLGKGNLQNIRMPKELCLNNFSLLPKTLESRLGKCDYVATAETEILIFGEPDLVCHSKGADKQDNRDGKLKHDQGFAEKGPLFAPCFLSLYIYKRREGRQVECRVEAG